MKNSKFKIQNSLLTFCILHFAFFIGCSIPNLEKPECREARQTVKEFYSYHFGNDMKFSRENLRQREKFLSVDFVKILQNAPPENDVFTTDSTDYPKAFRIGKCEVEATDKTVFEVLLFWKDDARSEQRAINVEVIKQNNKWLINKINNRP
jgi:hypothetical protein